MDNCSVSHRQETITRIPDVQKLDYMPLWPAYSFVPIYELEDDTAVHLECVYGLREVNETYPIEEDKCSVS